MIVGTKNEKAHLMCMGQKNFVVTCKIKDIIDEDKLESWEQDDRDIFMQNMLAKESLLSSLLESKYPDVKKL